VKAAKTWEAWKNQVAILGIAAVVIVGMAMLIFPSIQGSISGKPYRLELTAYFYDPLSPNPASLLPNAIQAAKRTGAPSEATGKPLPASTAFEARYDSALSLLHVVVGAEDATKAKAAARDALDSIVAAYAALPARQAALAAYLAARDYGTIKLLSRAPAPTAAAGILVAASILKEEEKVGSASVVGIFLTIGLVALAGLIAAFVLRGQADPEREIISLPAPKPSAR
jgi:hypothetical protein